mgnify:CR=1 FL=1
MFDNDFGNARVTGLREVTVPEPVSMVPQTLGWWLLGGLVLAWLIYFGYRWVCRWQANRYRGVALDQLTEIERLWNQGYVDGLMRVPVLLKRTAMHAFGRVGVADLNGPAWLAFLDQTGGSDDFTQGPGRMLIDLAYRKTETVVDENVRAMLSVTRQWITKHKANTKCRGRLQPGS